MEISLKINNNYATIINVINLLYKCYWVRSMLCFSIANWLGLLLKSISNQCSSIHIFDDVGERKSRYNRILYLRINCPLNNSEKGMWNECRIGAIT